LVKSKEEVLDKIEKGAQYVIRFKTPVYEIVTLNEPKQLFGQIDNRFEIEAECVKAREGVFNAK
jgi:hypothetical protein